jgi:hypothetical protein
MRSKHIYQKRNSHLKVRQEKKRMNLTSQKKASEHSHNGDSVFLLLVCLEDFVIAALETKLLLAQCYCVCNFRPNFIQQREINIVSLDIAGNVVVPLRLPPELDVRVCKAFTGTTSFFFVFPLFHFHIWREREPMQLMQIS